MIVSFPLREHCKVSKFRNPILYYHAKVEGDIKAIERKLKQVVRPRYEIQKAV